MIVSFHILTVILAMIHYQYYLLGHNSSLLIPMKRKKSKFQFPKSFSQLIFKAARRVETTFSQLTEQLNLNKVRASLYGAY